MSQKSLHVGFETVNSCVAGSNPTSGDFFFMSEKLLIFPTVRLDKLSQNHYWDNFLVLKIVIFAYCVYFAFSGSNNCDFCLLCIFCFSFFVQVHL